MKDGINDYVVHGARDAVNPEHSGTKAAAHYVARAAGARVDHAPPAADGSAAESGGVGRDFDDVFAERLREADEFYATVIPEDLSADARLVMRQALAGLLWSKQFYHYVVKDWLEGDPGQPPPPPRAAATAAITTGRTCTTPT